MQPLARLAPRLVFESIPSSSLRAFRASNRNSIPASVCFQCRLQIRRYAEDSKPSKPSSTSESDSSPTVHEDGIKNLPSAEEGRRAAITKRFSHIMDNLQGNIFIASQRINDLTGYSGIESLKSRITTLEERVQASQEAVRSARLAYKMTVAERASTQREVTTLLARKDSWTPIDLERFTSLYRMDHSNEQAVQEAATRLADVEREAEHAASKLSSSILSRYHEEQIWSDKIRRMSTWGTWGLMSVNVLLFLVFQFGFEPWRRARLVNGFEEKVLEALEREKLAQTVKSEGTINEVPRGEALPAVAHHEESELEGKGEAFESPNGGETSILGTISEQEESSALDTAEIHIPAMHLDFRKPETWKAVAKDLFSERLISMRKQDVTLIALEGAATGAAVVTIIASLLLRHS